MHTASCGLSSNQVQEDLSLSSSACICSMSRAWRQGLASIHGAWGLVAWMLLAPDSRHEAVRGSHEGQELQHEL